MSRINALLPRAARIPVIAMLLASCSDAPTRADQASAAAGVVLALRTDFVAVNPDSTSHAVIAVSRARGSAIPVVLTLGEVPDDVEATLAPRVVTGDSSVLTVRSRTGDAMGPRTLVVRARAGGYAWSFPVIVHLVESPGVRVDAPSTLEVSADANQAQLPVTLSRVGAYRYPIDIAVTGLPPGAIAGVRRDSDGRRTVQFTIAPDTPTGTFPVTVHARGAGGVADSARVTLSIRGYDFTTYTLRMTVDEPMLVFDGLVDGESFNILPYAGNRSLPGVTVTAESASPGLRVIGGNGTNSPGTFWFSVAAEDNMLPGDYHVVFRGRARGVPDVRDTLLVRVGRFP